MPEQPKPKTLSRTHSLDVRDDALRRLSRSPHPYHRQQFELPYGSEKFSTNAPPLRSHLRSTQNTDDEEQDTPRHMPEDFKDAYKGSTGSDSGTEADDEHFLKGLPAPKLRPHKGLRGFEASLSGTPSPILSPAILDEDSTRSQGYLRQKKAVVPVLPDEETRKLADKVRRKRNVEVIRRCSETSILFFLAAMLCCDPEIRKLLHFWRRELSCQVLTISSLVVIYPLRLLRNIRPSMSFKRPFPIAIPAAFDPAPLLYPPSITMLVSLVLSKNTASNLLPSMILGISSLPRHLIPSTGGLWGSNISHWFLSCLPLLIRHTGDVENLVGKDSEKFSLQPEVLVLLYPLHQSLCVTLYYLTTTSLLEAELQLLSVALIDLLLLASSPQAMILKILLWGGGIGLLVTCGRVLKWGVALARVPKWRFKRSPNQGRYFHEKGAKFMQKPFSFGGLGTTIFSKDSAMTDSSNDDEAIEVIPLSPTLKLNTSSRLFDGSGENGSVSAIEPKGVNFMNGSTAVEEDENSVIKRRYTLPSLSNLPQKLTKRTPSGRRKRATSSSVQAFFSLTQTEATIRKWVYAGYVYIWVALLILVGIREYVQRYALHGIEPIGWALGYLFGDLPWFRMEVVSGNYQRWICLPSRNGREHEESCYLGWAQHLRHASFGEANTRLILSAYWLAIIIVGLAVVFRLSGVYEVDTRRKVFHFMMVAMLLPATYVDPTFAALALILMLAIFLLLDLFRASQLPPLSKSLAYFLTPYVDGRDLKGPVVISHIFLLIGCAIPLWLSLASLPRIGTGCLEGWEVPTREVSMVSGVICVGMGDAAASLIGRRYGRHKWIWGGGKSIEGSVAFATAVGLALLFAKAWLRIGGWPANNDDVWFMTIGKASIAAWVASLTEAVLTGGNDNVVVPVVLWLCVKGLDI
ncbi:uncharacterized protein LY89DRAFT_698186 [Mollisia scopiformis]|uniref:dolichol kinase n=1 Tax=Mollisia scopiformis TaxID=149040 RepID=A0A194X5D1_MOLSC|nr:uncharacterized protein LY89DRAFT_698186 [Mollisia scopiformis]KUJ15380.1 hypothetical protein LY89DRAFT_698186 [Mollisia scopiformis]